MFYPTLSIIPVFIQFDFSGLFCWCQHYIYLCCYNVGCADCCSQIFGIPYIKKWAKIVIVKNRQHININYFMSVKLFWYFGRHIHLQMIAEEMLKKHFQQIFFSFSSADQITGSNNLTNNNTCAQYVAKNICLPVSTLQQELKCLG